MPLVCRICSRVTPRMPCTAITMAWPSIATPARAVPSPSAPVSFTTPSCSLPAADCRSFDELVLACESSWPEAEDLLHQGYLEGFLGGLGRADLARAARQAAQAPTGSEPWTTSCPSCRPARASRPSLEVRPLEVNLAAPVPRPGPAADAGPGQPRHGAGVRQHQHQLRLDQPGRRHGQPAQAPAVPHREQRFGAHSSASACAGAKKLEGRLNLETNGGGATVVIRAEVPVKPFPSGVLAGAGCRARWRRRPSTRSRKPLRCLRARRGRGVVSRQRLDLPRAGAELLRHPRHPAILRGPWPGHSTQGGDQHAELLPCRRPRQEQYAG